jgi:hypothetical protein
VKVLVSLERLLALSSCFWFGVLLLAGEVARFPDYKETTRRLRQ